MAKEMIFRLGFTVQSLGDILFKLQCLSPTQSDSDVIGMESLLPRHWNLKKKSKNLSKILTHRFKNVWAKPIKYQPFWIRKQRKSICRDRIILDKQRGGERKR